MFKYIIYIVIFNAYFIKNGISLFNNNLSPKIYVERLVIVYNDNIFVKVEGTSFKINRTDIAINITFHILQDIPPNAVAEVKLYEFLNNEYRPFAINIKKNLCSFLKNEYKAIFYPDLNSAGSTIFPPRCPLEKGDYASYNYIPRPKHFPPGLPFKKYMCEMKFFVNDLATQFQIYGHFDHDWKYKQNS